MWSLRPQIAVATSCSAPPGAARGPPLVQPDTIGTTRWIRRGYRGESFKTEQERHLWGAADILPSTVDAGDIFGLLFYERLCDVWGARFADGAA